MSPEALLGSWVLVDFTVSVDDGRPPLQPLGADARGLVVYSPDGWMSAVLSRGDREAVSDSLEEAARADAATKAAAFDTYLSYAGRWHLEGDVVHHTLALALVPGMVGRTLRRRVQLDGDRMTLAYPRPTRSGAVATYTLTWRRA